MKITCNNINPELVAKRMFYLAYVACDGPAGMGLFQSRSTATEDDVWQNVRSAGDYPGGAAVMGSDKPGSAYGDYVFGKMMKLGVRWDADSVDVNDDAPRRDYQSWCGVFETYEELALEAIRSLAPASATI